MGKMINGEYGYYYPYINDRGQKAGLQFYPWQISKYYTPGYLTDELIEEALADKEVKIDVPGDGTIIVKVVPYTTKAGKSTRIIKFINPNKDEKMDDKAIINANLEKIAVAYWNSTAERFDYKLPQAVLDKLDVDSRWRTFAEVKYTSKNHKYGVIKIYKAGTRTSSIVVYCKVTFYTNTCEMVSKEQVEKEIAEAKAIDQAERDAAMAEYNKKVKLRNAVIDEANKWLNSIIDQVYNGSTTITTEQLIKNLEPIVESVSVPNIDSLVYGLVLSTRIPHINTYFAEFATHRITVDNYEDPTVVEEIKTALLRKLKIRCEYEKLHLVRKTILDQVNSNGLEETVSSVDVDTALDLGRFREVQKILTKYKHNAPKYICMQMYLDILTPNELRTNILNMLKVYYDFYDMPEKDRKSIAKFVAVNKLDAYYEAVSKYDDVLEVLIENSRDPKLTKPLLESIAGTSRANVLKDKTYYFEKRGRLTRNVLLLKPIELLDKLKSLIKEFNSASNVAVLTNIELDADESFIFQFYTFADGEGDESGFDGRRVSNMTKIYNRYNPDKKIGFSFDNDTATDDDDDK